MINAELDSIMSELRNSSRVEENSGFWRKDEIAEILLDVEGERVDQWVCCRDHQSELGILVT